MLRRHPIEPEVVFGQIKYNKAYYRFRYQLKEEAPMDFTAFAIAFNHMGSGKEFLLIKTNKGKRLKQQFLHLIYCIKRKKLKH
ncbi:MAG: transposase [Prevotellaceae bacterium]|jgi:hypothetical protein|nr:transposase [Prevotellaceae bacterium]